MAGREKATPGNRLYIYRLLRSTMGVGKQEFLPNVEKILVNDGVYPEDMGFTSTLEMFQAFDEFVSLTEFKGGRVYVRLNAREDWDKWLEDAASNDSAERKPKTSKGKAKPWKHNKRSSKVVRPVKPKHKEAPPQKAIAAEPDGNEEPAQAVTSTKVDSGLDTAETAAAPENSSASDSAPQVAQQQDATSDTLDTGTANDGEDKASHNALATSQGADSEQDNAALGSARTSTGDVAPAKPASPAKEEPRRAPEPPKIHLTIVSNPEAEPKPQEVASATTSVAKVSDASKPHGPSNSAGNEGISTVAKQAKGSQPNGTPSSDASAIPHPKSTTTGSEPLPTAPTNDVTATPRNSATEQAASHASHQAAEQPSIPQPPTQQHGTEPQSSAEPAPAQVATPAPTFPSRTSLSNLPVSFTAEVHCKDELLSILMRTLPFDVDLSRALEEDWQVARSMGTVTGTRNRVAFPIRYLRPDGAHIELTLRRISRPVGGKRWALALVDGDDGTGTIHEAAGLEGAPQGDEGAWQDLSASLVPTDHRVSPLREMAQFCSIGTWDATLGALTSMAAPERWDYPGEGVGHTSRLGILREYLLVTLHRLHEQSKVAVAPNKDFCVANTGLMTAMTEDIYACFVPAQGNSAAAPWSFAGFTTAGSGELGRKITATFDPLPQPASYIQSLDQVMPRANKLVALDYRAIIGRQLGRLPRGFLDEQFERNADATPLLEQAFASGATVAERREAMRELGRIATSDPGLYRRFRLALDDAVTMAKRRVQASFRLCAPAYDPQTGLVDLLLPLALIDDSQADCALVLEPQASGNYQASSVLTLPRAYACARVISKYQPVWLLPEHVLVEH